MRDERPEYAAAPSLTRIALGCTERRLHRDSERLFRLVSSVAGVLGLGFAGLRRERVQVPLVLVENAELVDRYTLACLLHLCRVSRGPGPVLVLVTGEDDGAARPRWAAPPLADPLLARRTDAEAGAGDTDAATRRALRLVQRSYGLTLNYAGFNTRRAPIEAYSLAEWDSLLAVDLRAPFLLSQQAVRDMAAGGSGHIVNVLSTAAHTAIPFMAPYVAAKAGLLAMTRVLALEANRHGIRVSTVSPGATDSAGTGEERAVRPESVGAVIAATVLAPPDVMAAEIIVRPTALDG
ncbi:MULTISPECIES: SDR family oxidoreductase [unclassified Streptomyces]|uniref:SDR family oxidoreductase n=1 Tax=unclassified Streptomyces TaxID=2593676 RepID=UPI003669B343